MPSLAATTTYIYDDVNHTITVTHGTEGATPTYYISGVVINNNGNPLSGITMSLTGSATTSMPTDSNGFYGFSGLNNGSYTVTPSPQSGYTFVPSNRSVTINASDIIAQNFTGTPSGTSGTVRIVRTPPAYFTSLQAAYNAANSGELIQSQAVHFDEDVLTIDKNINVTLDGGYDSNFVSNSGNKTYLKGMIKTKIGGGTLTIKNFVIEN